MIAVVFALPQESRTFRALLRRHALEPANFAGRKIVVTHTGIGTTAATAAVTSLLQRERPALLVAAGFAGALDPRLEVGHLVVASNYSHPDLLARFEERCRGTARVFFGPLTTVSRPLETCADKAQLARETGALAVDMETSAIAAACQNHRIPLLVFRAISDSATTPLPIPFSVSYDLLEQRARPLGVALFLLRHPTAALPLARFIRDLAIARSALTAALVSLIPEANVTADQVASATRSSVEG